MKIIICRLHLLVIAVKVVTYKEVNANDGFVITANLSKKETSS